MKHYFIQVDNEQKGPLSLEELKGYNIIPSTMIWYNGLPQWIMAAEVPELKAILVPSSPPIFNQKTTTNNESGLVNKKHGFKTLQNIFRGIKILCIVIGAVVLFKVLTNNKFLKVELRPPIPKIIENNGGEATNSTLFNYKAAVDCKIKNIGGDGRVLVICNLLQGNKKIKQTQEISIRSEETQAVSFIFEEAKLFGGDLQWEIEAKPIQ